jgi:hypothetical protein
MRLTSVERFFHVKWPSLVTLIFDATRDLYVGGRLTVTPDIYDAGE